MGLGAVLRCAVGPQLVGPARFPQGNSIRFIEEFAVLTRAPQASIPPPPRFRWIGIPREGGLI